MLLLQRCAVNKKKKKEKKSPLINFFLGEMIGMYRNKFIILFKQSGLRVVIALLIFL